MATSDNNREQFRAELEFAVRTDTRHLTRELRGCNQVCGSWNQIRIRVERWRSDSTPCFHRAFQNRSETRECLDHRG